MKYNNTITASSYGTPLRDLFANLSASAGSLGTKFRAGFARTITNMQVSRMQTVLNGMSDDQLETAGIARKDIPQHARALVVNEYDGL